MSHRERDSFASFSLLDSCFSYSQGKAQQSGAISGPQKRHRRPAPVLNCSKYGVRSQNIIRFFQSFIFSYELLQTFRKSTENNVTDFCVPPDSRGVNALPFLTSIFWCFFKKGISRPQLKPPASSSASLDVDSRL